jgi:hypothetical protein
MKSVTSLDSQLPNIEIYFSNTEELETSRITDISLILSSMKSVTAAGYFVDLRKVQMERRI